MTPRPTDAALLAALDAALDAPLELPPPPPSRAALCRRSLALLGGVASARAVASQLVADGGPQLSVRQVREALRSGSQALGGGYCALPDAVDGPLAPWLRGRLRRLGDRSVDDVVADVLARWPHGDAAAIRAWLHQDPPGVAVVDGVVRGIAAKGPAV